MRGFCAVYPDSPHEEAILQLQNVLLELARYVTGSESAFAVGIEAVKSAKTARVLFASLQMRVHEVKSGAWQGPLRTPDSTENVFMCPGIA